LGWNLSPSSMSFISADVDTGSPSKNTAEG
jgi:hypothetical protein